MIRPSPSRLARRPRRRFLAAVSLACAILAFPAGPRAATLVVDAGGGGDFTRIQPALDAALTGDTVEVWPGTYTSTTAGTDPLGAPATALAWLDPGVVLVGRDGPEATLLAPAGGAAYGVYFDGNASPEAVSIEGVTVTGAATGIHFREGRGTILSCRVRGFGTGIAVVEGDGVDLFGNDLEGTFTSIGIVLAGSRASVRACGVRGCGQGLRIDATSAWDVADNVIEQNITGIWLAGGFASSFLTGNSIADNATGLQAGNGPRGTFLRNIIARNSALGINWSGVPGPGEVTFACNDVAGNAVDYFGDLGDRTGVDDNIGADPQFCGTRSSGNLQLQSDSPCTATAAPCGVRIGALDVGCTTTAARETTWGAVKARYRH